MSDPVFRSSKRIRLWMLINSIKTEQKEVTGLFDLQPKELDFSLLLLLSATRALRCHLILQHFGDLFQIQDRFYDNCLENLNEIHASFLDEAESQIEKKYLPVHRNFSKFIESVESVLALIEKKFSGKLQLEPQNNLLTRYLNNLINALKLLREILLSLPSQDHSGSFSTGP